MKKSAGFGSFHKKLPLAYKIGPLLVQEQKWQQMKTIIVGVYNDY